MAEYPDCDGYPVAPVCQRTGSFESSVIVHSGLTPRPQPVDEPAGFLILGSGVIAAFLIRELIGRRRK